MGILEHAVSVAATQDLDAEACAPSLAEDGHEAPAASDCLMAAPLVSPSGAGTEVSRGAQDSCDKKAVSFSGAAEAAEVVGVEEARRGCGQDEGQREAREYDDDGPSAAEDDRHRTLSRLVLLPVNPEPSLVPKHKPRTLSPRP